MKWISEPKQRHYDYRYEYDVDQNVRLIKVESAVLDVKVLEGEAGVRELEDVFLGYDCLVSFLVYSASISLCFTGHAVS